MRPSLFIILLTAIALSGCPGNKNINDNKNTSNANRTVFTPPAPLKPNTVLDPNFKPCNEYYPLVPGSVAKYVMNYSSGIVADATVVVDSSSENGVSGFTERTQIVDRSGGFQIAQNIERHFVCEGDKVRVLSEKTESRIENDSTTSEFNYRDNSYAMIEPSSLAQKDATWSYGFKAVFRRPGEAPAAPDAPVVVVFTVKGEEELTLPTGKVKALRIERKVGENRVTDYYTRGLGLVKRVAAEGTSWELKEYSGLKPVE